MFIRTVCGDVDASTIGHTQAHEHLLCDVRPPLVLGEADDRTGEITLQNVFDVRRRHPRFDLLLADVDLAVEEMISYRRAGGSAIVDAGSDDIGRDPEGLRRISKRSGVHVVMGSGHYVASFHPSGLAERGVDGIAATMISDVHSGVGEPGIRAGVLGEIGLSWPVTEAEAIVMRAACVAQLATGAALLVHPGRDPEAPLDAVRRATAEGVDPSRVIVSHLDRTLFTVDELLRLADTGVYLEFDQFGQESSFYNHRPFEIAIPNDAGRVRMLTSVAARGHLDRILIAQDICHLSSFARFGGEGYAHILNRVLPIFAAEGFTSEQIHRITVDNPVRALALTAL